MRDSSTGGPVGASADGARLSLDPPVLVLTLQITVSILRDQLTELQPLRDALALSRTREDTLQNQVRSTWDTLNTGKFLVRNFLDLWLQKNLK